MPLDDLARGTVEITGAAVVAESGPVSQDFLFPGASASEWAVGKRVVKPLVVGNYCGDAGLLQHYFGEPNAVGIAIAFRGSLIRVLPAAARATGARGGARGTSFRSSRRSAAS